MKKKLFFFGFILFLSFASAEEFSLNASVTVNPSPIYLDLEIEILTEKVEQGKNLLFLIELSKEGSEEVVIDLKYEILRKGNQEVILTQNDFIELTDYNSKQASILIPSDFKPGKYELRVTATYFSESDVESDEFLVKKAHFSKRFFQVIFFLLNFFSNRI